MATAVGESDVWEHDIIGPEDDDPANAGSVNVPFGQVASRTHWLRNRLAEFFGDHLIVTASAATDILTCASAHGLTSNTMVRFSSVGGTLPGNLSADIVYYLRDVTSTTFRVSDSAGGVAINLTSDGTGTLHVYTVPDAAAALFAPAVSTLPAGTLRAQLDAVMATFSSLVTALTGGNNNWTGTNAFREISYLAPVADVADGDIAFTPDKATYLLATPTISRTVSLNTPANDGQEVTFRRGASGAVTWTVKRTGSPANLAVLGASSDGWVTAVSRGGVWKVKAWGGSVTLGADAF